ncbi:uncharacterized protein BKA55DRAFT_598324 [Fusarium redolens]|uniref:Ubiquitin-like domain-containing protein n=1 Tax=Fusarium redolens TaxID=48865 RepID=A0A9P9G5E4_FUSRE|nr:uncharacterized protein BKA55DRAFT_598324 [Fusarium redolens]KAH7232355.1 hypothetical protein BKA55DRAFT_598324 [Fusarium redolens]
MSFGYAVGDVVAVLGLFERIAIELRNYKDAPAHFQLRAELNLVRNTLKHVLNLDPECVEELQTLEKIRAIVVHCSQPLQAMADKMRSKDSSLGHFKTTRSLSAIGIRLHWSMIAKSDVDSLRQTVMSQMSAINILLSVQQLLHANVIARHASNILSITSRTQSAVDTLAADAKVSAEIHSKQSKSIDKHLTGIETSMLHLTRQAEKASATARRHTAFLTRYAKALFRLMQDVKELFILRMLLDISGQLKRIIRAIEAIPLYPTLDIVRLGDALGESWALPLQACRTWEFVVYANERPGVNNIVRNLFALTHAKTGMQVNENNWAGLIKAGFHVEQAMVIRAVHLAERSRVDKEKFGPQLPRVEAEQKTESFRKVKVIYRAKSIRDVADAYARLVENPNHLTANAIVGLELLRVVEHHYEDERARELIRYLKFVVTQYVDSYHSLARAVRLNPYLYEAWYNLGVLVAEFKKCTELMPGLSDAYDSNEEVLRTCLIRTMIETPLQTQYEAVDQAEGEYITLNPIQETGQRGSDDDTDEEYSV